MTGGPIRAAAVALVLVAGCVGLFATCFERREVAQWAGESEEARANRYLALGRFLERMGREVRFLDGPSELERLPPRDATLVLTTRRRTLGAKRSGELLDWVAGGGHLVVMSYALWDDPDREPDALLDRFGLRQHEVEDDDEVDPAPRAADPAAGADAPPPDQDEDAGASGTAEAEGPEDEPAEDGESTVARAFDPDRPLRVRFERRRYFADAGDAADWTLAGEFTHLIVVRHGAGRITAVTDDFFLRNDGVGRLDHAEFALGLSRLGGRDGPVWIVTSERWPGLASLAWRHARPVLVALPILGIAWIWRASRRFGPVRAPPEAARRSWMEHLDAVGRFHWQEDRGRALLEASRARALRTLRRTRPGFEAHSAAARAGQLARALDCDAEDVRLALEGRAEHEDAFVRAVAILERIQSSR